MKANNYRDPLVINHSGRKSKVTKLTLKKWKRAVEANREMTAVDIYRNPKLNEINVSERTI